MDNPKESTIKNHLGLEHIDTDNLRITRFGSSEETSSSEFICRGGDIIFGRRRAYLRKLAISDRDYLVSTDAMIFRSGDKTTIYPPFIPFLLQSEDFWTRVISLSEGSMSPRIKWKTMATLEFEVPSIREQERIAKILWSLEDNLEKTRKLVELTEKLRRGALEKFLKHGTKRNKLKKSELGDISQEFEVRRLGELTKKITKGATPTSYGFKYTKEGIDFIKIESIDEEGNFISEKFAHISEETNKSQERSVFQEGDVLLSIAGALGRVAIVNKEILPANTNQAIAVIRISDRREVTPEYLKYYLSSGLFQSIISDLTIKTAQANLNLGLLPKLPIVVPSKVEQMIIVNRIDDIVKVKTLLKLHLLRLRDLKKQLLNLFLSGDILIQREVST